MSPELKVELSAGAVMLALGLWSAVTVTVTVAVPFAPLLSVAVSVIVCAPTLSALVVTEPPVPSAPSTLELHASDVPLSAPSSASLPVPVSVTDVPSTTLDPAAGALIAALGA